jgi:hypothetical protein
MAHRLTFTELLDHAEGRLPAERSRWVEDQVALDEDAAHTLAWIEDFLAQAQAMPLTQPPPELSARLRAMFSGAAETAGDQPWTTAHLLHESRGQGVAGVRSSATDTRHVAFDSPAGRFIVEVRPGGAEGADRADLSGLVLVDGAGGASLTFLEAGVVRAVARCQRDGQFEALGVPRAVDELQLVAGDVRLRAQLDLRED